MAGVVDKRGESSSGIFPAPEKAAARGRRSPVLSFVWPLPSRCERVGLGAPGWGNHYPEHSCDLLGLVNIPEPTPLNFANQLGGLAGTQTGASGRWPFQKKDSGVLTAAVSRENLFDPSRLASVCSRNLPTHLEDVYRIFAQSRTCCSPSQRELPNQISGGEEKQLRLT